MEQPPLHGVHIIHSIAALVRRFLCALYTCDMHYQPQIHATTISPIHLR